jgi:Fic family protein
MRTYRRSHPWLKFSLDMRSAPTRLWLSLGEAQSKCEHVAGIPLQPDTAKALHKVYLAKGVLATTAIEGNTLSEDEVLQLIDNKELRLPPSREYLKQEISNIVAAFNAMLAPIQEGIIVPMSSEVVCGFNRQVLNNLEMGEGVSPGQIRKDSRIVGHYRCPPAEDCAFLLDNFCSWMNGSEFVPEKNHEIVCGIVKAIVAHVYFVWIHPFGDGNGRTARLLELKFLMEAGVPSDAAHLLSNHYNQTRTQYYQTLDAASKNGGDLLPFIEYAVTGFVDQLRDQINIIKKQQVDVTWINHVHARFQSDKSPSGRRRRDVVLALSGTQPTPKSGILRLTPELAAAYASKTAKTVSRDINVLRGMELIRRVRGGYIAQKDEILAFLPIRKPMLPVMEAMLEMDDDEPLLGEQLSLV